MKLEYRQLKDITPRAIFEPYIVLTSKFMQEFTHLVSVFSLEYNEVLFFDDLVFELEVDPDLADLLIQYGFIEKVVEKKWEKIGWRDIAKLQPNVQVKKVYDGYEEIFIITKEPTFEYIPNFKRKELVYSDRHGQHFITDLFNGDVYILTEGK